MKNGLLLLCAVVLLLSCDQNSTSEQIFVRDIDELKSAISQANPGDEIVMKNGIWNNAQIKLSGNGTERKPITLRAETPGEVIVSGQSFLHIGGKHLVVDGLSFKNGYAPKGPILRFMIDENSIANNCRITNTAVEDFTNPNEAIVDQWIQFYGKHNQLDHCYIAGKSNDGATLMVYHVGNKHVNNYHQIVNNYFGPRPRKNNTKSESIQIGTDETRLTPGRLTVANNFFEACNGDDEIISDQTNYNSFTNNIFYKCEGGLVLRHGNFATVDRNIFIGGDDSDLYGGIRVLNTGHWITNNYLYKINGTDLRSPLAILNGIKNTPMKGFRQVTDIVVAYNTWVDCRSTWQIGVGQNNDMAGKLPVSELRSEPPIRSIFANNLIFNEQGDESPIVNHDDMDGILFKNNIIDNNGTEYSTQGVLKNERLKMKQINDWLFAPENETNESLNDVYIGYQFEKIQKDLFGAPRTDNNQIGAISNLLAAEKYALNKKKIWASLVDEKIVFFDQT